MIWFACKQCGSKDRRPDDQAGSLVYCTCGQANRVPWESTAEPPAPPRHVPASGSGPVDVLPLRQDNRDEEHPRRPRKLAIVEPDPEVCFQHAEVPRSRVCDDCGLSFCENCLVTLSGKSLCGPCKNFRLRRLKRPPRTSVMGVISMVLSLLGAAVAFWLSLFAIGLQGGSGSMITFALIGLLLPAGGTVLGILGLRECARTARIQGRSVAMIGFVSGVAAFLWCVTIIWIQVAHQITG